MLKRLIPNIVILVVLLAPSVGSSQTFIAGVPVHCIDASGVPVATIPAPQLNDVGMARIEPNGLRVIYLNPFFLQRLPISIQLFWYAHECAHHALGHTFGFNQFSREIEADCWAIRLVRDQGWINKRGIQAMFIHMRSLPGSAWGHLPGPQRFQHILNCYNS